MDSTRLPNLLEFPDEWVQRRARVTAEGGLTCQLCNREFDTPNLKLAHYKLIWVRQETGDWQANLWCMKAWESWVEL